MQLGVPADLWVDYGRRAETRWEHGVELQSALGLRPYTDALFIDFIEALDDISIQTDRAPAVAEKAVDVSRSWSVLLPSIGTLDEVVSASVTRGTRTVHAALADALTAEQKRALDALLRPRSDGQGTQLT